MSETASNIKAQPHTRSQANSQEVEAEIRLITNRPYVLLTLTTLFWAGNAIAGKFAVGHVSPFLLTSLRWLVAILVLLPFAWVYLKRDRRTILSNLPFLFAMGAIGFALFNNLLYLALNYTTAINVAILQGSMPLFVFAFNFAFFAIRTRWLQLTGFGLTLAGVIITSTGGNPLQIAGQTVNTGDLIMLLAALFYGLYSVVLVRKPDLHWLSFITVLAISSLVTSIPFSAWEFATGRAILPDEIGLAVILYTAIFPSIVSQTFWIRGLDILGSNRGGIFINLVPIFASLLAVLLLGEAFLLYHLLAMCLVIGGVWLSQQAAIRPQSA